MLLPFVRREIPGVRELFDAVSPYGYPGPLFQGTLAREPGFVTAATGALLEALRTERYVSLFVRLHPLLDSGLEGLAGGELISHGATVVVDLSQTEQEQWRQHQSGHRSEINKALSAGREVFLDDDWHYFDDFVRLYTDTMRRPDAKPYYSFDADYFRGLRNALSDRVLHLGVVRIDGRVAAAALFTTISGLVQYHLSGTDEAFARERPTKLLLHHVRQWASRGGHRWLHLGGGLGGRADSLFRFKAGFSTLRRSFYTWRVVVDEPAYTQFSREKQPAIDPADLSGFAKLITVTLSADAQVYAYSCFRSAADLYLVDGLV